MVTSFQQDVDITACTSGRGQLVIGGKLLKLFCLIALMVNNISTPLIIASKCKHILLNA